MIKQETSNPFARNLAPQQNRTSNRIVTDSMRKKEQENLAANKVGNKMEAIIEEEKSEYTMDLEDQ